MKRLAQLLASLEGKSYKAYKILEGRYYFDNFELQIDHVQGDPFANPTRCRLFISAQQSQLDVSYYSTPIRCIALEDFLGRCFTDAIKHCVKGKRGSGMSGQMLITDYGQQVLRRNAVLVNDGAIELRLQLGLPANKRTISASDAKAMLLEELPALVNQTLTSLLGEADKVLNHIDSVDNQQYLRQQLKQRGLVAFIADGSNLARRSGVDDRPLNEGIRSCSPESLAVELSLLNGSTIRGLGIPEGVSLIVGGGFHGKSTLLHALEHGVYDHIPGDGRERVVTLDTAVKIRSEDRRAITNVDISPFINHLPQGKSTKHFSTQDASGSTSQAANIMESLTSGSQLLLIDEDTSANNFMMRDERMKQLVCDDKEPITPLIDRIEDLKMANKVSLVLVMGGTGDFFDHADTVIMLDNYQLNDVTSHAKQLAKQLESQKQTSLISTAFKRQFERTSFQPENAAHKEKIQALATRILRYGITEVDVSHVEQLVTPSQLEAIGYLLRYCYLHYGELNIRDIDIADMLGKVLLKVEQQGLDLISPYVMGTLSMPRKYELVATVNRLRTLVSLKTSFYL